MKHRIFICVLFAVIFSKNLFADENLQTTNIDFISLRVSLDKGVSIRLYDKVILTCNNAYFEPVIKFDSVSKRYTLTWDFLRKGKCLLKLITVFGNEELYEFHIKRDTSFFVENKFDLLDVQRLKILSNGVNRIKVYYRTSGCYHNIREMMEVNRDADNEFRCTLITDSIAYKDSIGSRRYVYVPVYRTQRISRKIVDDLFELIRFSQLQRENTDKKGIQFQCMSTTHRRLFILLDNVLFQFHDSGICEWNAYSDFREAIFPY